MSTLPSFDFACPICKSRLDATAPNELYCANDVTTFCQIDGIWRLLRPDRIAHYEQFIREYQTIRQAEGRGSRESAYYRALPFADITGRMSSAWEIRAASFRTLIDHLIAPLEASCVTARERSDREISFSSDEISHFARNDRSSLKILDLGAGNGWLSYHLAKRGHSVGAVDLLTNKTDGLGAHIHYDAPFTPIQAEFDHLPLTEHQVDLVIFNSSLHYAVSYETTLDEAWRVVKENGCVVILDSPVYTNGDSGRQMLRERQQQFRQKYGFPSNSISSEGFLTFDRLDALAASTGTQWRIVTPRYGWRWRMRQQTARLRARREPAQFMLIIGTRDAERSS